MELNDFGSSCNPEKPVKDVGVPHIETIIAGKNTYVYDAHTYHMTMKKLANSLYHQKHMMSCRESFLV